MPRPARYRYLIAYAHAHGFGASEIHLTKPITGWTDIQEIKGLVGRDNGVTGVAILNFQRFDDPPGTQSP